MEFQEKRKLKKYLYSKVVLVIFLAIIIWLLCSVWNVYKKQDMTRDNLAKTAASLEGLQAREKMLTGEIQKLKTDVGIEEEIREKYGLIKPGEEVIVIVDNDEGGNVVKNTTSTGFWQKIKDWLR